MSARFKAISKGRPGVGLSLWPITYNLRLPLMARRKSVPGSGYLRAGQPRKLSSRGTREPSEGVERGELVTPAKPVLFFCDLPLVKIEQTSRKPGRGELVTPTL